jgi:predicted nucleic acid-binding protein
VTTLFDTGPLVAVANADDRHHARCVALVASLAGPLLVPPTVLVEACWILNDRAGPAAQAALLDSVAAGELELTDLLPADVARMAQLVRTYHDLRLDPADASVIAVAERLGITQIATLDRRDFTVVRPAHVTAFTLLPG